MADLKRLQFVGSDRLRCNRASVQGWEVRSATGRFLGRLVGVVAGAAPRTIRYFVVERPYHARRRRRLLAFCPVRVDREAQTLRLEFGGGEFSDVEARRAAHLSDEDADGRAERSDADLTAIGRSARR